MKREKKLLILGILALVVISVPVSARLGGAGASASFLSMGAGARPIAMGCAYTALADGPDALYWNPAGIAKMEAPSASFGQAMLFAGMLEENVAVGMPVGAMDAVGVQILAHLSGPIEITTYEDQQGTGNYYSANNYAVGLSYARKMTEKFTAGATVKVIDLTLHNVAAWGLGMDVGATYELPFSNLRIGFVVQNFGPDMAYKGSGLFFNTNKDTLQTEDIPANFQSETFGLPFTFGGGIALDLVDTDASRLTLEADFFHLSDQAAKGALGLEYAIGISDVELFLRGGLGLNTAPSLGDEEDSTSTMETGDLIREILSNRNSRGPSAGMGLKVPFSSRVVDKKTTRLMANDTTYYKDIVYNIFVDYSFEWHWYLAPVHRASVAVSFSDVPEEE
ncbi:PorV/PorQ family protein [candidate division WOR-3 bacterium]|nr:PorV/PorQ family protein [candidate division WOR-3 bacterium]